MTNPTPPATLTEALSAFQAELPRVQKGARNDHFKSSYADLADVVGVVLPALARQGLAWVTVPTMTEAGFRLEYSLQHVGGERIDGSWPLPNPTESTAQAVGSAITYAKRYALSAVTGVAPDQDDDGNSASQQGAPAAAPKEWKKQVAAAASVAELHEIYQSAERDGWLNASIIASLNARRAVLSTPAAPDAADAYEAAASAEYDAAVARGEVAGRV
ncbi:MAG: ERF family protein [Microbacterium ginsengisoli]|uniref:ERF family protein n=1 Tax=Microbacterium TaxID=33882 RepID=UPI000AD26646|nr:MULTISPECIES: ERF family protein [unclassified Microbacterium]MBN9198485.1 ERF family protein [Microbacterium ginsengisoli]